jgi:hypothetical protein
MSHIKKFEEFSLNENIEENKRNNGQFKKGDVPFNKGKKREEYLSQEVIDKMTQTEFKTGEGLGRIVLVGKVVSNQTKGMVNSPMLDQMNANECHVSITKKHMVIFQKVGSYTTSIRIKTMMK